MTSDRPIPNKPMQEKVLPFLKENNVRRVLDYGCGKFLRDALLLTREGMTVDCVELEEQILRIEPEKSGLVNSLATKIPGRNYDAALLNYVIQVIPTKERREEILKEVCDALKTGGYFVLTVRNMADIKKFIEPTGIPHNDGFIMKKSGCDVFVRGYELSEVEEILQNLKLTPVKIYKERFSYLAISQKY
jgi:SAM-dependent methyltransferase